MNVKYPSTVPSVRYLLMCPSRTSSTATATERQSEGSRVSDTRAARQSRVFENVQSRTPLVARERPACSTLHFTQHTWHHTLHTSHKTLHTTHFTQDTSASLPLSPLSTYFHLIINSIHFSFIKSLITQLFSLSTRILLHHLNRLKIERQSVLPLYFWTNYF